MTFQTDIGKKGTDVLFGLSNAAFRKLERVSETIFLSEGSTVFKGEKGSEVLYLVADGVMRVQLASGCGKHRVYSRVVVGQGCFHTRPNMPMKQEYLTEAIAETDIEFFCVPFAALDDLVQASPEFAGFVFETYSRCFEQRMHALIDLRPFTETRKNASRIIEPLINC